MGITDNLVNFGVSRQYRRRSLYIVCTFRCIAWLFYRINGILKARQK